MQNQSESFRLTLILCQTTEAANDRALANQSRVATIASLSEEVLILDGWLEAFAR